MIIYRYDAASDALRVPGPSRDETHRAGRARAAAGSSVRPGALSTRRAVRKDTAERLQHAGSDPRPRSTLCRRWSYTNPSCRSQVGPCTVPPSIACRSDCSSDCRTVRGEPRDPYVVLHQRGIGDAPISIEGTQTPSSAGRRRLNDSFPSLHSKRKAMLHEDECALLRPRAWPAFD